jgi:hypothetical protein
MGGLASAEGRWRDVTGIGQTQLLLLVGLCWVPIILLGIFGFALVLRRDRRPSAMSFASTPRVRLGTVRLEQDGRSYEVGFEWANGSFVSEDGQSLMPTVIAELDAQNRVEWGSEQQQAWFRQRFVDTH